MTYSASSIDIPNVVVDTGAASTVINADPTAEAGVYLRPDDTLRRLRGVGGHEHVFLRRVDRFASGPHGIELFDVEIGEMDYGFEIGGILGMDFFVGRACGDRLRQAVDRSSIGGGTMTSRMPTWLVIVAGLIAVVLLAYTLLFAWLRYKVKSGSGARRPP